MRPSHSEKCRAQYLFHSMKDQSNRLLTPQNDRPLLYLKCWEMDYPYLRVGEQQKRWLPVVVNSAPNKTLTRINREGANPVIDIARNARLR